MVLFKSCSCWQNGTVQDLLQCAPCPPPMLNYSEFRQHALNRTLCLAEVCNITRRCRPEDPDVEHDCFPKSTTHDGTSVSSSHTTDHSIFTTDFSASTTDYTTEFKTDPPKSAAACNSTCLLISIGIGIAVCVVVAVVILMVCLRRKRRQDKTKNKHESIAGVILDAITYESEGMDADANKETDKSFCNIPDNGIDNCYSEDGTNPSDIDQPDSERVKFLHTRNNMDDVTDKTEDTSQRSSEGRFDREMVIPLQTSTQSNTCENFSKCEHIIHSTRL